jgi:hypothetical protein
LSVLRHSPFAIFRSIFEEVGVSHETVHPRLTESVQLPPRFLKCGGSSVPPVALHAILDRRDRAWV